MKVIGLIPARMESSRLKGKPLADILGLPMIVHVFKRCEMCHSLDDVYVVTDSVEIKSTVEEYGGKVIMTSSDHETGTDRIAEAVKQIDCDIAVNIQGDEALVRPDDISAVIESFKKSEEADAGILVIPFKKYNSPSDIKVVLDKNDFVMYLSRNDIPSGSRTENPDMLKAYHIVPFRKEFLLKYSQMEKTPLEKIEFNEYLRILENSYKIKAARVNTETISVDTQQDLDFVRSQMPEDPIYQKYKA